jgi:hypothetical protein
MRGGVSAKFIPHLRKWDKISADLFPVRARLLKFARTANPVMNWWRKQIFSLIR